MEDFETYSMSIDPSEDHYLTELLAKWNQGDKAALSDLMAAVFDELHRRAGVCLRRERQGHTLQTTALVNEVYLRIIKQNRVRWQNRNHFLSIASQMMRRILLDHARKHEADKRGGTEIRVALDEALDVAESNSDVDLIALDQALVRLEAFDPRQSQIVELRFFGGLSVEETAEVMGISVATLMREWRLAKMWLYCELNKENE